MKKNSFFTNTQTKLLLTTVGLSGLISGCNTPGALVQQVNAQEPTATSVPPTIPASPTATATPTVTSTPTNAPSPTAWPTITPLPTARSWNAPVAWQPASIEIPVLQPIPVVPTSSNPVFQGVIPVNYSPPDGIDVFGGGLLRWEFFGNLADDEWFDVKIKPFGSQDSAFVDWTKEKEYPLTGWNGWQPGLYTWQIGIVKGYKEGDTKHFIEDTGHDSQPFVIKWQTAGGGGGGGGGNTGGGGNSGGGGGGGGNSGGS